jgi:hypothetical protein
MNPLRAALDGMRFYLNSLSGAGLGRVLNRLCAIITCAVKQVRNLLSIKLQVIDDRSLTASCVKL